MGTIDKWEKKKRPKPIEDEERLPISRGDIKHLVRKTLLETGAELPAGLTLDSLRLEGDLDLSLFDDLAPEQGFVISPAGNTPVAIRWYEDVHGVEGPWAESEENVSDGNVPDQVTGLKVQEGQTFLLVRWTSVHHNTPVKYHVHVSTSSSFTADDTNRVVTTAGNFVTVKALADQTPFAYNTTYYIQVVPEDIDGLGPTSAEISGAIDADAPDDLLVGTVTAEQLEAILVLTSTLIAGDQDGSRVEVGVATAEHMNNMIGIHALASDGETVTFMIDSQDGSVYIKGRIAWGSASELTVNDILLIHRQPIGFEVPTRVQSTGTNPTSSGSTATISWPTPTTTGNLLLMALAITDPDDSLPTPSTPAGWTLVTNASRSSTSGEHTRLQLWKIEDAASRSGMESITLNDTVLWTAQLFEYAGVQVEDVKTNSNGRSTTPSTGTTATTTQNDELAFALLATALSPGAPAPVEDDGYTKIRASSPFLGHIRHPLLTSFDQGLTTTGAQGMTTTMSPTATWVGAVVTFKAKVAGVEDPDADKLAVYAKNVDTASVLHVRDENGEANSAYLSPPNEKWHVEYVELSYNLPSIAAHTSGADLDFTTAQGSDAGKVEAGDLIEFLGFGAIADAFSSSLIFTPEAIASEAGHIKMRVYNAHTAAVDIATQTWVFKITHRTT